MTDIDNITGSPGQGQAMEELGQPSQTDLTKINCNNTGNWKINIIGFFIPKTLKKLILKIWMFVMTMQFWKNLKHNKWQ